MGFIDDLLNTQPRPEVELSYPVSVGNIDIPKSTTNRRQYLGSSGREVSVSGEVWTDSDVQSLIDLIQTSTSETVTIPEFQESIKVIPTNLSISETPGTVNRHRYELTLEEIP